jgi:hypothetical protein
VLPFLLPSQLPDRNKRDQQAAIIPHPIRSSAQFNIVSSTEDRLYQFQLIDVLGRSVKQQVYNNPSFTFDTEDLPEGIYFYRLQGDKGFNHTGKLQISR